MKIDLADSLADQLKYLQCEGWERDVPLDAGLSLKGRKRTLRVDLVHRSLKLACEVDGGIWNTGGHNRGVQIERDCLKSQKLFEAGYRFCRFTAKDVKTGNAASVLMGVQRAAAQGRLGYHREANQ